MGLLSLGPRCGICDRKGCKGHTTVRHLTDGAGRQITGPDLRGKKKK